MHSTQFITEMQSVQFLSMILQIEIHLIKFVPGSKNFVFISQKTLLSQLQEINVTWGLIVRLIKKKLKNMQS
mgnify:CR=1 FL=1